ncbi:MAG TPA: sigma 54-interacting transcriptional regulator, partial [Holophaga sp.]|nr:sigma 54-interacting transcriptional regulator [Holophaga sp.]
SAFGEPKDIVEAMRCGADEFLPKPFDLDHFHDVLTRLLALVEAPPPDPREPWIASSPAMKDLDQALAKAAESQAHALFLGEKGVGKLRAARRLHTLRDPLAPFLPSSAASLPDEKHLKLLARGSIYLTDLEALTAAQVQRLGEAMARGHAVHWMGGAGTLREIPEPLRWKLGVLCFQIPPLRERKEDILPLFRSFLEAGARQNGRPSPLVERSVERDLLQRAWPGNVRELVWCASQALQATQGAMLGPLPTPGDALEVPLCLPWPKPAPLEAMLAELAKHAEPSLLRRALASCGNDPAAAAAALGLTGRAFAQRLREGRISLEED